MDPDLLTLKHPLRRVPDGMNPTLKGRDGGRRHPFSSAGVAGLRAAMEDCGVMAAYRHCGATTPAEVGLQGEGDATASRRGKGSTPTEGVREA